MKFDTKEENYMNLHYIKLCDALRNLVSFAQFKKREKHPWAVILLVKLQPVTLLKVSLLHGCYLRFLNCTKSTKLRKESKDCFADRLQVSILKITEFEQSN